jgi:hypothetical protein
MFEFSVSEDMKKKDIIREVVLGKVAAHLCVRAALHLEAGPIHCVRGLKYSLVIGQKAQIGPNLFTPKGRADLVI